MNGPMASLSVVDGAGANHQDYWLVSFDLPVLTAHVLIRIERHLPGFRTAIVANGDA